MTGPESDQLSSIRAIRPVIPSESLRHFMKSADALIADGGFELVDNGNSEVLIFATTALHATLFVRRAPATPENNDRLRKIANYIESPKHEGIKRVRSWPGGPLVATRTRRDNALSAHLRALQDIYVPNGEQPVFRTDKITGCNSEDPARRGFELALLVEPGQAADVLIGQSSILNEAAARTNADKLLPKQKQEASPLEIPFMRAPFRSEDARDEYIDALSAELPVHSLCLSAIAYKHALIDI